MSLTTYSNLKTQIANWLNRTDLEFEIPTFISLTESRLAHELRIPTMEKVSYIVPDTAGYATLPPDFLEIKDIFFNSKPISRETLSMIHSQPKATGIPTSFAREANELVFYPTPTLSATDKLKVIYYYQVPDLSDVVITNDLLKTVPELYLYGALAEASAFLGSDGSRWEQGYQTAFGRATQHARIAEASGATPYVANGY